MKSKSAVIALSALAQESRRALYRLLVKRGTERYTPGDTGARLDIPAPTRSFHLKTLTAAGLLEVRRDGRHLNYSASIEQMNRPFEGAVPVHRQFRAQHPGRGDPRPHRR